MPPRRARRAQVAIFVILGIVVIAFIGFAIYVRSLTLQHQLEQTTSEMIEHFTEQRAVQGLIDTCVDEIGRHGLHLLAGQGGVIYADQGGDTAHNPDQLGRTFIKVPYEDEIFDVAYGLRANDGIRRPINPPAHAPPRYPDANRTLASLVAEYTGSVNYPLYDGWFGDLTLPKLCNWTGPNRPGGAYAATFITCEQFTYNFFHQQERTIQDRLARYLERQLPACTNFSILTTQGTNVSITGDPFVNATFLADGILISLNYPVDVNVAGRHVSSLASFEHLFDARYKELYDLAAHILKHESKEVRFAIEANASQLAERQGIRGVAIHRLPNICNATGWCLDAGKHDDALLIIDEREHHGEFFITAIENRPPVLDWIHQTGGAPYDLVAVAGETITLTPRGYDPDDGEITYHYSGWMEEHTDTFTCDLNSITTIAQMLACTQPATPPAPPERWSASPLYAQTGRAATISTDTEDYGLHTVRITITDEDGLEDWQDVRILVFPLPEAQASGHNLYSDVRDDWASIEDPYCLDGTGSLASFGTIIAYHWVVRNGAARPIDATTPIHCVGAGTPFDQLRTTILSDLFSGVGAHEAQLIVEGDDAITSSPDVMPIEVKACLPHRASDDPYPYNASDALQADHACCLADATLADTSTICYERTRYGPYWAFENPYGAHGNEPVGANALPPYTPTQPEHENDIYRQELTRACSGVSGNDCTGRVDATYDRIESCADWTSSGQSERCTGPPMPPTSTTTMQHCTDYDAYESFEQLRGMNDRNGDPADGVCGEQPRCSTLDEYDPFGGGPMLCQGVCGGGQCKTPIACSCSVDQCGATCDDADEVRWVGTSCSYSCDTSSTCEYQASCQSVCPAGTTHCRSEERCYYDVGCTNTWPGCVSSQGEACPDPGTLDGNTCLYGSASCDADGNCGLSSESCPASGTEIAGACYHGTRACEPLAGCTLTIDATPPSCAAGESLSCTASGWRCS